MGIVAIVMGGLLAFGALDSILYSIKQKRYIQRKNNDAVYETVRK